LEHNVKSIVKPTSLKYEQIDNILRIGLVQTEDVNV
jgi:hypothetical protein